MNMSSGSGREGLLGLRGKKSLHAHRHAQQNVFSDCNDLQMAGVQRVMASGESGLDHSGACVPAEECRWGTVGYEDLLKKTSEEFG